MALVDETGLYPERREIDPRLYTRALGEGRVRGAATTIWQKVLEKPLRADTTVRESLREARQLHSAERRLVADGLYAAVRHHRWLAAGGDDWWTTWLRWANGESLEVPLPTDPIERFALLGSLTPSFAEALWREHPQPMPFLAASNRRAPLGLRVNTHKTTRDVVAARLAEAGIPTTPMRLAPDGLVAEKRFDLHTSQLWKDGWIEVQDEGSQLVIEHAEVTGTVIDLCAGAGGKALHAAAKGVRVLACDTRATSLEELDRRAKRAGVRIRTNALPPDGSLPASFPTAERVLVDAPCSGSGTLRRHPELRWRLDEAELTRLPPLQASLLARGAGLVKPGGWLVYATCSALARENENIVDAFLAEHPEYARAKDDLRVGPDTHGTDGLYVAALVKE